jgi:translation initiation factor IF-2
MKLTDDMIKRLRDASARGQKLSLNDLTKPQPAPAPSARDRGQESKSGQGSASRIAGRPQPTTEPGAEGGDDDDKKKGAGGVIGRDSRHKGRQDKGRQGGPRVDRGNVVLGPGGQVDIIEQQAGSRRGPRAALLRKHMRGKEKQVIVKEGKIEIALPITIRSLSETIGMKVGELSNRLLKETGQLYGANSTIDFDAASLIAVEKNIELVAKKQETEEDRLLKQFEELMTNVDPAKLKPRPPIVTIMGHVDHGKTSLLDKIRQNYGLDSDVVSTEAGGITQVIRAWSVKREVIVEREVDGVKQEVQEDRFITFLDTPGHEAFTKMRARGANVTDIAVIVVAATDGVMPQTQEAISHAKAAEVKIIVAINKVDMPNANVERTKRQLYNEGLIPDDMGGDVQFVETSAVTGQGISDLLDTIVLVAEVEELTADPDRPAAGTCLEAYMTADEGVMATVLIQQGTLNKGDIILCGSTYGRVRAMYNDLGRAIKEAGPSTPVRITGLGNVPNADDPFYVVDELTKAQEIATAREIKEREQLLNKRGPQTLDSFKEATAKSKITELKVILKAEARGSVEAIRKELEKLVHEEVRTRVLHTGIGAITESDVQLALTSPDDTLVIGFNVTADDAALKLAEERGISLREYQIIYNLVDDVKAALEGRLKPIEEVIHLGRAVVRETFKISKVGTIAGCYVTSGVIERSARVRVIREGVVIFPSGEKVVGLDSLKRFKDDAKEVREGFECGLKITGYDDIKVNDVIEAFKIEIKQRTL